VTAARYFAYLSVLVIIGTAGARLVVTGWRFLFPDAREAIVAVRLTRAGLLGSIALVLSMCGVLAAQAYSWFGPDGFASFEPADTIVFTTAWGLNWQRVLTTSLGAIAGFAAAKRVAFLRGSVALAAAIGLVLTVPLLGHGGSHGARVYWLHVLHLLGAGLWIGTLGVLTWATWPVWKDDAPASTTLRALLRAFSPIALTGGALMAATGLLLSIEHTPALNVLWTTSYGQTLAIKVGVVAVVAVLGWINFRRHRGPMTGPLDRQWLRRLAVLEAGLALGVIVALTAWLTDLPVPH
jgi:putative copper export protein